MRASDSVAPISASRPTETPPSIPRPLATWLIFVIVTVAVAVTVGSSLGDSFNLPDAEWYLRIARGDTHDVIQPFASRQLGPLLARTIAYRAHISIESGFMIEAAFSLLVAVSSAACLLVRSGVKWGILLSISLIPFWANLFNGFVLPDLLYAALTGVFLLFLWKRLYLAACAMLLPMQICREATILVLFCLLIAGWRRIRLFHAGIGIAATFAGMRIVKTLANHAGANQEHVSPLLYMAGKIPWNFSKNLLGFPLWNNLNRPCEIPAWQTAIHIGGMRTVGVCSFSPAIPMWTLSMALASFGLLPLLFVYIWRQERLSIRKQNILVRFCIIYGTVSFGLAPMLGASIPRLFSYAWPLFLVAVPIFAQGRLKAKPNIFSAIIAIHILLGWLTVINHSRRLAPGLQALMLCSCLAGYVAGWVLLSRSSAAKEPNPTDRALAGFS